MPQVRLAVRQLAEFLLRSGDIDSRFAGFERAQEGARIHRRLQKAAGPSYQAEVPLACRRTVDGIDYCIEGRADGIFPDGETGLVTIDEIKTTTLPSERITEDGSPCHWAQGMVYGAIWAGQQTLPEVAVRLTYYQVDEEKLIRFVRRFTRAELEAFFTGLLAQYAPWARRAADHLERRTADLSALAFPFPAWRTGQKAMAGAVYHACCADSPADGGCLFCQAPTGIGKTMSTLFPALKAMGNGKGEKLFYLTARTTARTAAENALAQMHRASPGLALRGITLTAKEKACLCPNEAGRPECIPERCPYAKGYYDRVLAALAAALDQDGEWTREAIAGLAREYTVCPFELGLDLSEWCDVIVGDYNYLFDPTVHLRRYFDARGDWLFLIDEAHNLPDRAREMYSARFSKSELLEAKRALGKGKSRLKTALSHANEALLAYRKACAEESGAPPETAPGSQTSLFDEAGPVQAPAAPADSPEERLFGGQEPAFLAQNTRFYRQLPKALYAALHPVLAPAQSWLEDHRDGAAHETILQLYFSLQRFLRTAEGYDEHYVCQFTAHGADLTAALLCLDPAPFVEKSLACGRAAVLFSATLAPAGYYKQVLGCENARAVALRSPFPAGRLGLYCLGNISTRYRDRAGSLAPIADALAAMTAARRGNYLAFFPSYQYLQQVYEVFAARHPEQAVLLQQPGLDEAARADFLARFDAGSAAGGALLGFCVMGGVFGEGIDLAGERLIGCAVVGTGLPQVNPQQEMLRQYYDEQAGCGFDYAYRFPGMKKVLQAAGRVIRTPEDRGVVLLIDDRFGQSEYRRLMPPHWAHLEYLYSQQALEQRLAAFWQGETDPPEACARPAPCDK